MTAKEYLLQIRKANRLIELKQNEIDKLKLSLSYRAVNYENERVQGGSFDRTDLICKMIDFEHELNDQIDKLIQLKSDVIKTIDKLKDDDYISLLYMRYLDNKSWEEISIKLEYSYRWILKLHGRALQNLDKILKEDT